MVSAEYVGKQPKFLRASEPRGKPVNERTPLLKLGNMFVDLWMLPARTS